MPSTRSLSVDGGTHGGLPCVIVDPRPFERWDGEPASMKLAAAEQARLFQNLGEAMEFQGLQLVIE